MVARHQEVNNNHDIDDEYYIIINGWSPHGVDDQNIIINVIDPPMRLIINNINQII